MNKMFGFDWGQAVIFMIGLATIWVAYVGATVEVLKRTGGNEE